MMLSVVIPTRNEERNIVACLRAFDPFRDSLERIVVDNASDDRTRELAEANGARVFVQGPERSAQRNRGWREAKGSHILFVDADMILPEATIREILARISSEPDLALYVPEIRVGRGLRMRARNFERSFYNGTCIDGLRVMPRRFLEAVGGYDADLVACEDWDLDRRLKAVGVRTALTEGALQHNEARQTFARFLRKKAYYATSVERYRAKWRNDAVCRMQFGLRYRYFGVFVEHGRWRRLVRHPLLTAVMLIERIAVGFVYLLCR